MSDVPFYGYLRGIIFIFSIIAVGMGECNGEMKCRICWRVVRGELPDRSAGDAGMVPLTSRETAKGGEQRTQLASLKQVSAVLQRSHPRAKRKPDPRIKARHPGASPLWELREEGKGYNSLRSDKCSLSSNAFSCEPRGSQLPGSRRACARRLIGAGN